MRFRHRRKASTDRKAVNNSSDELRAQLANRTVVVDTSALLMDGVSLLNRLEGVDLVIPAIVMSELEGNRKDP